MTEIISFAALSEHNNYTCLLILIYIQLIEEIVKCIWAERKEQKFFIVFLKVIWF